MPEGNDVKKVLYRALRRAQRARSRNRVMAMRVLTAATAASPAWSGFDTPHRRVPRRPRQGGDPGRRRLRAGSACPPRATCTAPTRTRPTPATATRWPTTPGAELTRHRVLPDQPADQGLQRPGLRLRRRTRSAATRSTRQGERFIDCDYWSGQMMPEFYRELHPASGPVYLKLDHLPERRSREIERSCTRTERPSRGRFHARPRHTTTAPHDVEMHISEIGLCSGHWPRASGSTSTRATTVPGLYAAGDLACVPHNYMLGAFVYGEICRRGRARATAAERRPRRDDPADDRGASASACYRAAGATRRLPPQPGRVQAAPLRQRLPAAAQDRRASMEIGLAALRADARTSSDRDGGARRRTS